MELASMLKEKTSEHVDLLKDIVLERKEEENFLQQTTLSLVSDFQNT